MHVLFTRKPLRQLSLFFLFLFCSLGSFSCMQAPKKQEKTMQQNKIVQPNMKGIQTPLNVNTPAVSKDIKKPSKIPPGELQITQIPQFVVIGFDDNGISDNIYWILSELATRKNPAGKKRKTTFDGTPVSVSFYMLGSNGYGMFSWKKAWEQGHEIGNHTYNHPHGLSYEPIGKGSATVYTMDSSGWQAEIQKCLIALERLGIPRKDISGYRQPYLEYSGHALRATALEGFTYDCSIEEGMQADQDGKNFFWPYTLEEGSPGDAYTAGNGRAPLGSFPGLWEMPVYTFMIPQMDSAMCYGLLDAQGKPYDLYEKLKTIDPNLNQPKVTGFDYNLWTLYGLTGSEFTAVLKYNLDLRLEGNRAPFTLGAHTDEYSNNEYQVFRRQALIDFIDYALSKPEVRIVRADHVLNWIKKPKGL